MGKIIQSLLQIIIAMIAIIIETVMLSKCRLAVSPRGVKRLVTFQTNFIAPLDQIKRSCENIEDGVGKVLKQKLDQAIQKHVPAQ